MKGMRLRKIVALMFLVLGGAGVLVAQVWKQNTYVRLSKEAVSLGKQGAKLRNEIALLQLEVGELRKPARLERLALGRFGLVYGQAPILVYPEGRAAEGEAKAAWRTSGL